MTYTDLHKSGDTEGLRRWYRTRLENIAELLRECHEGFVELDHFEGSFLCLVYKGWDISLRFIDPTESELRIAMDWEDYEPAYTLITVDSSLSNDRIETFVQESFHRAFLCAAPSIQPWIAAERDPSILPPELRGMEPHTRGGWKNSRGSFSFSY